MLRLARILHRDQHRGVVDCSRRQGLLYSAYQTIDDLLATVVLLPGTACQGRPSLDWKRGTDCVANARGNIVKDWFSDDSFWIEFYPTMFNDAKFEEGRAHVEGVLSLVEFPGKRVLDLCCGPGRHSIPLALRGLEVTGVDRVRYLLDRAEELEAAQGAEVEWVLEDMREFVRPRGFDLILSMATSFGYFQDKQADLQVLHNIHRSLEPGGTFLLDTQSKESVAGGFKPWSVQEWPDGTLLVGKPKILDNWTRVQYDYTLIKGEKALTYQLGYTVYSGCELEDLLRRAGFSDVVLYGDFGGVSFGLDCERLIAVAKKPV